MRLPRGFRASAERLALELRGELDLDAYDRVDPLELAYLYGIPVVGHTDLNLPLEVLTAVEGSADWSAATVFDGPRVRGHVKVLGDGQLKVLALVGIS